MVKAYRCWLCTAHGSITARSRLPGSHDVLEVLLEFIDGVIGAEPLLIAGHSAGDMPATCSGWEDSG
jgi:hypothetical protein